MFKIWSLIFSLISSIAFNVNLYLVISLVITISTLFLNAFSVTSYHLLTDLKTMSRKKRKEKKKTPCGQLNKIIINAETERIGKVNHHNNCH